MVLPERIHVVQETSQEEKRAQNRSINHVVWGWLRLAVRDVEPEPKVNQGLLGLGSPGYAQTQA